MFLVEISFLTERTISIEACTAIKAKKCLLCRTKMIVYTYLRLDFFLTCFCAATITTVLAQIVNHIFMN